MLVRDDREQVWQGLGAGRLLLEQHAFDPAAGVVQTTQTLIEGSGARESRTYSVRVYAATEMLAMLDRAGFAQARCLGGFDATPFTPATRLVIVASR